MDRTYDQALLKAAAYLSSGTNVTPHIPLPSAHESTPLEIDLFPGRDKTNDVLR